MGKKTRIFLVCSLVAIMLCGFVGCKNLNRTLEDCISEVHNTVLYAEDDNFFVEVIGGQIEKDYALDGKKNELKDFVSIKVRAKKDDCDAIFAEFSLQNTKYSQELTLSPIDNRLWTAVVDDVLAVDALDLTVLADEQKADYKLAKVQSGEVKPLDVLKEAFGDKLMECFDGESFNCEVTLRLVKSPDTNDDKYYWYVVVYKPDKSFFGLMIDSVTGDIVAKKS